MVEGQQPRPPEPTQLSITVSLSEIYNNLCADCRERLIDYISGKAGAGMVRDGLRRQLEPAAGPEGSEDRRREHS